MSNAMLEAPGELLALQFTPWKKGGDPLSNAITMGASGDKV
jgi:hypothetical protein